LALALALTPVAAAAAGPDQSGAALDPLRPREEAVLYDAVPASVAIRRADGTRTTLAQLWRDRPLLLTLVFARCAGVCPPYVTSLQQAVEAVGGAGAEYDVAVISFDPGDTPDDMRNLAEMHGVWDKPGWVFGVVEGGHQHLEEAIGFWSRWDAAAQQFDHPAMTVAIDAGHVVRLLAGATVPPHRLREVVWELRHVFVGTYPLPSTKVAFRCLRYSPASGRVRLDWGMAVLLLPGVAMFTTTAWIFRHGHPDRRRY
jgi:cytochrome oxidase Cu insertion factor (SCO1/SenC/PrrC family)